MKGNNSINFCTAQLVEMLQHYFDSVLFRENEAPKVTGIKATSMASVTTFEVSFEPKEVGE